MNKFFVSILLATTFVIGLLPETATADSQSDMAALKQALERIGEGIPENPRQDRSPAHRGIYNVMEFGAKGDGIADDTQAIQNALNAAYYDGGGIVNMPTGAFLVKTHLTIPSNVTLEGVWRKPHWGQIDYSTKDLPKRMGTILLAVEGQGDPEGTPFITLGGRATDDTNGGFVPHVNAAISGLSIHYPEQIRANPPHAYPWTIRGTGDDCGIMNVNIMNSYQAVDFGTYGCGRHYVDGLYAYPFKTGIYVNACFDVGRLNNIHFWPFFDLDPNSPLWKYTRANGTAFRFGRTDGELVSNSFCIFYNIGAHLIGGPIRMNGPNEPARYEYQGGAAAFTNVYLDVSTTAVQVDDSMENSGYSFNNCFIMSKAVVGPRNRGPIRFNGCGFWASPGLDSHVKIEGVAPVYLEGCHFANWDYSKTGAPCVDADGRRVIITGCDFLTIRPNKHKLTLGPNVREAVVTSNLMQGGISIQNNAPAYADIQIGLNAGNPIDGCLRRWVIVGPFPNPDIENPAEGAASRAGFDTDYLAALGGEDKARLEDGTTVEYTTPTGETITRTAANRPTNDAARMDFARRLQSNHQVGYAYVEFNADTKEDIDILFGSSDSAKVWVNGELVHSVWTPERIFAPGQDRFTIHTQKGINSILVKVENGPGNFWEFMMEARDKDGNALDLPERFVQQ